jgi:hypothetical protein
MGRKTHIEPQPLICQLVAVGIYCRGQVTREPGNRDSLWRPGVFQGRDLQKVQERGRSIIV